MDIGWLTILPAILVIVLAVISKRTTEPLFMGVVTSYIIISIATKQNIITLINDSFFKVITDYDTVWLIIVCGLFGSLIALLAKSNGTLAFAKFLGRFCNTGKKTLFVAWILGIIIFIDDYMNILTVSACTKKLCDKQKVPREALAYVVDSTGAPVCVLLPFSTWAIFFAGVFYDLDCVKALGFGDAMTTYIQSIPFMFYAMVAVIMVPLFVFGIFPKIGPMKKAYDRIKSCDDVYAEYDRRFGSDVEEDTNSKSSVWDFLLPIITLIVVQLITNDMFIALVISVLLCVILYIPRKKIKGGDFCDLWIKGFADLVPSLAIIVAALFMRQASEDIMLPEFIISVIKPVLSKELFPMIAFITVSCIGFITGSNWGIPAVCAPIILPLGAALDVNLLMVMAAIVCGGTFCSHACFYSDATVLTSSACGVHNMDHVKTQMPYAIISAVIAALLFLVAGFIF